VIPSDPIPVENAHVAETRQQLLSAAGEVFAEVGFREATVREICRRAGANIAAVNYHFGDKETLYTEVLDYAHELSLQKHPLLPGVTADSLPEERLLAFVHSLLARILDVGPGSWHGQLMAREMVEPTESLDVLVEQRIRPLAGVVSQIVAPILGLPEGNERVRLCGFSVVSQCMFYKHCGPVVCRLYPDLPLKDPGYIARLARHITQFSLAAMKHLPPES
jgi:TetR/AcrR family transcriptional regulator, regulator of cefoperazone and chloramphenicol sensitivity